MSAQEAQAQAAAQDQERSEKKKRRRQLEASAEPEQTALPSVDATTADVFGDQNSDDEPVEAPRTAEDDAFIDDEGADPAEDVFGDEEEGEGDMGNMLEAAEDDDEIDRMFDKKKRRAHEQTLQDIQATVESFLARMEAAAEGDMDANSRNKPAIQKLRMLPDVQDILSNQNVHNEFLDGGLLGVFKAWIEPMPDGSLPNITVRSAVLKLLAQLPIDISYEGRKEQLKKSGLGKVVMFLFKLPDETAANRYVLFLHVLDSHTPKFTAFGDLQCILKASKQSDLGVAYHLLKFGTFKRFRWAAVNSMLVLLLAVH